MKLAHTSALVTVPASTTNLGPGFDSFGLALELRDEILATAIAGETHVEIRGEGAGVVPTDERHLVVRVALETLDMLGAPRVGLRLNCLNRIPHGRGLGSSGAAIVTGILIARGLIAEPEALDSTRILDLATRYEGHPDNVAAALFGNLVIAGPGVNGPTHTTLAVHEAIRPILFVPREELATTTARGMLPAMVSLGDASFNAGRAAMLSIALTSDPSLLFTATEDRLHQAQRSAAMPISAQALTVLRASGFAATISGAGPSVLVLDWPGGPDASALRLEGFQRFDLQVARQGCTLISDPAE